ncbi:NmrA family NAD(P)-binding protein [Rhodoferax sp.]|uniref:NmrA family NAD(P)-binding protein n=1 Tax=Rhodoferax sp. TaxID=50421 RepID=UPI00374D6BC0
MFAIMGITGQVGGAVARSLRGQGVAVRAVLRSADKGVEWQKAGCEIALADVADAASLQRAFTGVDGVFILLPSNFDPSPGFPESAALIANIRQALLAALPPKVVVLSTIGAQATQPNLLGQLGLMEQALGSLPLPITFLRAAWFMENAAWDVQPAQQTGVIPSFLQPLDKPVAMVATADVGRVAAELLQEDWQGLRVVELEGPQRVTPQQIAEAFARLLGREVRMEAVPRDSWDSLFRQQGMLHPLPRMQMLDGFNQGWIEFAQGEAGTRKGLVPLQEVLRGLVERTA